MTAVATVGCVVYFVLGSFSVEWWGWSADRAKKFRNSAWLLLAWAAVDWGHFIVTRH